jgi:multicomponent K+:H+ antiporter subunit E
MTRWLSFPLMSGFLLAMWLLLVGTLSTGHIFLGLVIAVSAPLALSRLDLPPGLLRRPLSVLRLAGLVFLDIVRSNIAVARIIVMPERRNRVSGFMTIPLDLRSPYGLAVLACIITSTPGTAWVGFESATRNLTIHVLDLTSEEAWIAVIKGRYERLLLEIFE